MKYAIARIGGHQYKLVEGQELLVDRTEKPEAQVLMVVDGDKVSVGTPIVEGVKVALKVVGDEKGDKIHVFKYKSKSRYRKHTGFRHSFTKLRVDKISA